MTTKAQLEQRLTEKQSECIEWVLRHDAVERERDQGRREMDEATAYARSLAMSLWEQHYKRTSPVFLPFDEIGGLLTQIDNMASGMVREEDVRFAHFLGVFIGVLLGTALASLVAGVW